MAKVTRARKPNGQFSDGIRVRGFYRVHIVEHDDVDGAPKIVGDSGWVENTITTAGKVQYLALALASNAGSKAVQRMALGAGTEPSTAATSLESEMAQMTGASSTRNRASVATSTSNPSGAIIAVQFAATWASATAFCATATTIKNIGLYNNTDNAGTLFSGTTFGTSALNTNQDVNKINDLESLRWAA